MEGKYSQGFPDYGPERMGAPMRGFTRISDDPIMVHCAIYSPAIVVVLDDTLLTAVDVAGGTPEDGLIIVNTIQSADAVRKALKLEGRKLFTVDATGIALELLGRPITNTAMLGALIGASGVVGMESLAGVFTDRFDGKAAPNVAAAQQAHDRLQSSGG